MRILLGNIRLSSDTEILWSMAGTPLLQRGKMRYIVDSDEFLVEGTGMGCGKIEELGPKWDDKTLLAALDLKRISKEIGLR